MTTHPRSRWTNVPAANAHAFVASQVKGTVVHWNGPAVATSAFTNPRSYLEGVRRFHVNTNGWSDIAYNLAVDQRGDIWTLRGLRFRSAANGNTATNRTYVAVLAILGQGQLPSSAMLSGIRQAVSLQRAQYPRANAIAGHRDVRPGGTACPGPDLYAFVQSGRFVPMRINADIGPRGPWPLAPGHLFGPDPNNRISWHDGSESATDAAAVRAIQRQVRATVSSHYDRETRSRVAAWQRFIEASAFPRGLRTDGLVDEATWRAMVAR